jgi:ATP-dependent protease ClpP protease subunit
LQTLVTSLAFLVALGVHSPAAASEPITPDTLARLLGVDDPSPSPVVTCHHRPCVMVVEIDTVIDEDVAKRVVAEIKGADEANADQIIIRIDSYGGQISSGMTIIHTIEATHTPITGLVDASAFSMAFMIEQVTPMRVMTSRSSLLTHEARLGSIDNATLETLRAAVRDLEVTSYQLAMIGSRRLSITLDDYLARTHERDWIMAAPEAKAVHAVDCVFGGSGIEYVRLVEAGLEPGCI